MVLIAQRMLDRVSEGNEAATAVLKRLGAEETTHLFKWSDGVTVGEVTIETADDEAYADTWAPVAVVTFSGTAPKQDYVRVPGAYAVLRHRITTPVDAGTVSSRIDGSD